MIDIVVVDDHHRASHDGRVRARTTQLVGDGSSAALRAELGGQGEDRVVVLVGVFPTEVGDRRDRAAAMFAEVFSTEVPCISPAKRPEERAEREQAEEEKQRTECGDAESDGRLDETGTGDDQPEAATEQA
ncbi:hypothetical protein GCM10010922_03570 [Microbacterium sorbitolivorans]|uniref:Uncharacterized protein n=1 Tax=Microbacterium sorbitolivorans TaxID=1867410 RepID=A0A367Y6M9_9MICO|nr:hypothetical protein [Microbacterium sorbitolivorans]RCK61487.1 hypothetical protein DTO57_02250 [Microbacterium sorbitolivorans]GGF31765.1 hypothetical protein GCM10010922_03570 [Microbacterium sorbitolivorans]